MKRKIFYSIAVAVVVSLILSSCRNNNVDIPVESVTLDIASATLEVNGKITLVATVLPDDAFNQLVQWTSTNPAVATVEDGVVTAKATGTAIIIVITEDGGLTATCTVTVIKPVTNISLNKDKLSLVEGTKETLTVTVVPPDATEKAIIWSSSNNAVATVDNGTVTAVSVGTAVIRATTQDGKYAQCDVTVTAAPIPVQAVTLNLDSTTLAVGNSLTLTATVLPADATDQTITWSSNNAAVATVDNNGKVTAAASTGTATSAKATIKVTSNQDNTKYAECVVTVYNPVTDITLDKTALTLNIDSTYSLVATILPTNATNKTVNWSSSNTDIAIVNDGLVTAIAQGVAAIVATTQDGAITASCIVTVNPINVPVTSLSLPHTLLLNGSDTVSLTAALSPGNATNQNVTWTSSDPTIAKIGGDGLTVDIIAVAPTAPPIAPATGDRTVYIAATSVADPTMTDTCEVTVKYVPVLSVTVTPATLTMNVGERYYSLTATVLPTNASIQSVEWKRTSTEYPATVAVSSTTAEVWAMEPGNATVSAISKADPTMFDDCIITVVP